jgi:hypothetical protein
MTCMATLLPPHMRIAQNRPALVDRARAVRLSLVTTLMMVVKMATRAEVQPPLQACPASKAQLVLDVTRARVSLGHSHLETLCRAGALRARAAMGLTAARLVSPARARTEARYPASDLRVKAMMTLTDMPWTLSVVGLALRQVQSFGPASKSVTGQTSMTKILTPSPLLVQWRVLALCTISLTRPPQPHVARRATEHQEFILSRQQLP